MTHSCSDWCPCLFHTYDETARKGPPESDIHRMTQRSKNGTPQCTHVNSRNGWIVDDVLRGKVEHAPKYRTTLAALTEYDNPNMPDYRHHVVFIYSRERVSVWYGQLMAAYRSGADEVTIILDNGDGPNEVPMGADSPVAIWVGYRPARLPSGRRLPIHLAEWGDTEAFDSLSYVKDIMRSVQQGVPVKYRDDHDALPAYTPRTARLEAQRLRSRARHRNEHRRRSISRPRSR